MMAQGGGQGLLIYQENQQKTGQTYFLIALHTYVDLMD
jgi:hypothetical protein